MTLTGIPENWSIKKIREIGEVVGGGTPSTMEKLYYGGDVSWITPKDLSDYKSVFIERGERNITKLGLSNSSARLLPAGTVLFTSRAPIGYVAIAKKEVSTNQGFKSIICNTKIVNNKFIYYVLKYNKNNIENIGTGSTFKEVTGDSLKNFEILIPTLREQENIAKILFDLDSKIELNRQMNATLEAIGQALFKCWFVDFEFQNEEGKPYRSSGGEMVETEFGKVPRGWEVKPFSEVINVNPNRKLAKDTFAKKVGMADLNAWQSWVESWQLEEYKSGPRFQNGDTLFARITPSLEHGKTVFVSFLDKDEVAFGSTEFIIFAPKIIESDLYIFHLARSEYVREAAIGAMTGSSGRQRVPEDLLNQLLICVPTQKIIEKFHKAISLLFEKIANNANQTRNLSKIRDALLPKLMSGEIRVFENRKLKERGLA